MRRLPKLGMRVLESLKSSVYDVQFRRMEAEIWLNEEKAR